MSSFPRKRTAVACNYCRHRKRRCDSKKPVCGLCAESGIDCEYPEVGIAADETLQQLLNRLTDLEAQVKQQSVSMATSPPPNLESRFHGTSPFPYAAPDISSHVPAETRLAATSRLFIADTHGNHGTGHAYPLPGSHSEARVVVDDDGEDAHDVSLTIPIGHWTTTGSLFLLPQVKSLIGDYPDNFFLQLESSRTISVQDAVFRDITDNSPLPQLHAEITDPLISAFFAYVHPAFPVLDRDMFMPLYHQVLEQGLRADAESALCLVLLALGKVATNSPYCPTSGNHDSAQGLEYFAPAYRLATALWGFCYEKVEVSALTLIHAALYFQHLNLPLQAWRMVHLTSVTLQSSVASSITSRSNHDTCSPAARLVWACFIFESDTLAEFHVPRTGIELLVGKMQFPSFSTYTDRDALLFLAVCSIRRLLNRIHSTLYVNSQLTQPISSPRLSRASESPSALAGIVTETKFQSVCAELVRQLKSWYESLPDEIKPDLDDKTPRDLHDGWLRLRYWSAMHIIGRPFVIHVVMSPNRSSFPPHVIEYCKLSLDSCRSSIAMAGHILRHRTQYTWIITHARLILETLTRCIAVY
ncbi:hypothetical protein, variant [Cladophialophora immunda]|uniref:Zn(2)-C6 fungal-type domain-containing protein n=1 Tax=Cladophialophora immunda TaxID=569365 RepID=A0A0D1Z385_9EURO|nr:hypothetical protein, variant [Cladophialophora immunda]KIW22096.1 hypothetical protein, variant [Cladophialophora immunda]